MPGAARVSAAGTEQPVLCAPQGSSFNLAHTHTHTPSPSSCLCRPSGWPPSCRRPCTLTRLAGQPPPSCSTTHGWRGTCRTAPAAHPPPMPSGRPTRWPPPLPLLAMAMAAAAATAPPARARARAAASGAPARRAPPRGPRLRTTATTPRRRSEWRGGSPRPRALLAAALAAILAALPLLFPAHSREPFFMPPPGPNPRPLQCHPSASSEFLPSVSAPQLFQFATRNESTRAKLAYDPLPVSCRPALPCVLSPPTFTYRHLGCSEAALPPLLPSTVQASMLAEPARTSLQ